MKKIYIIGALACTFTACKPSVDITTVPTAGSAIFTNYLAVGNSLTAGYADGTLTASGQLNSYPQRLFEQFSKIQLHGAQGNFYQPLLHSDMGFGPDPVTPSINNRPRLVLEVVNNCLGIPTLSPVNLPTYAADPQDAAAYVSPGPGGQINNIGVPGIRVADYPVPGYGALNIYAARFYNNPTGGTPLDELQYRVNNLHPTFFTMWLGANDVLGYALAGGQGNGSGAAAPILGNYFNSIDITPASVFQTEYDTAVQVAIGTGAKGALINIPDVTSIPFFTTIPANGLYITRQTLADSLNAFYASKNYTFQLGYNYFIIQDNAGVLRQAVPGELILLNTPQDSLTCAGWGSFKPILKQYVLTTDEIQNAKIATAKFNAIIAEAASRNNLALVDMNAYMGQIQSGMTYNGVTYSAQFVSGSAFSLDGVHLTPRGYAIVANQIINAINKQYGSTLTQIDPNQYHGVVFP